MRFRKTDRPETPDDSTETTADLSPETASDAASALALAETEAAAAEANAAAARARAEEIRLRRGTTESSSADEAEDVDSTEEPDDTDGTAAYDAEVPATVEIADTEIAAGEAEDVPTDAQPSQRKGRFGSGLRWATATLAVLLIGAFVTMSALMVIHHRDVEADNRQAAEYAAAARQGVVTLMSLDFDSVDEDVKRIIDNSTGDFRKEFEDQAKDFATVAKESKVVTEATATAAAVESMTDKDAVVLVTATSTVTNAAGADQDPRSWRLTVNLTRDGDDIKMSKVEFAP